MIASVAADASVLVKLFLREPDTAAARALVGSHSVLGPQLVVVEVCSAIVRRFRLAGIDRAGAELALQRAHRFFTRGGPTLTHNAALQPRAEEIALDLKHALRDCFYIALAEQEGCALVTADATLVARAAPQFPFVRAL
jgi:predicted nucleic acid-binding protein